MNAAARIEAALSAGQNAEARALAEALVRQDPADANAWNTLGVALRVSDLPWAAIAAYTRSLELAPDRPGVLSNLGNAWRDVQRFDDAIACHRAAVARAPLASHWENLGVALRDAARYEEALAAYDRAADLDPKPRTLFDRSHLLLMLGRYREGWEGFEHRWRLPELSPPPLTQPRWDGSPKPGATLLLWPEQGFGDTILSTRFVAAARERVGRIVLVCQPELLRLFQGLPGADLVIPYGPLPAYDVQAPLMSLPRHFAASPEAVPAPVRFHIPDTSAAKLRPMIAPFKDRLKVGIVWSGSVTFKANNLRATRLARFLELATVPGARLFSLQKGPRADDLNAAGATAIVTDLAPALDDFADTAAAIAMLDLIVMTDSSVAHLAGSLGKPVWNLLPRMPYWLYGPTAATTPWYTSMRLFRQPTHGDWDEVLRAVRQALTAFPKSAAKS